MGRTPRSESSFPDIRPGAQTTASGVGPASRISARSAGIADHRRKERSTMTTNTIRLTLAGGDDAELDARIASVPAAPPTGTEVTVSRGIVFNRHGMPPTP